MSATLSPGPRTEATRQRPDASPRARFVANAGGPARGAQGAGPKPAARPKFERDLSGDALRAAVAASPLVFATALLSIVGGIAALAPSATRTAWGWAAFAVWAAWGASPWVFRPRAKLSTDLRITQRAFSTLALACMAVLAVLPWLYDAEVMPVERWLLWLLLSSAAFAGAAALAPLRAPGLAYALLPLSPLLAETLLERTLPMNGVASVIIGAALGVSATLVSLSCHRGWMHTLRARADAAEHIREIESERDAAMQADREKSRFLAIASHDLRQPVHAIGLFAATLEKRLLDTPEEPLVRNIVKAIDGLDRSFNAMLDISRLDAGTVEPNIQHFPLRDLFRRLHMHFTGQAELKGLALRFKPGGKSVSSDPQLLERILGNLIQNAIKYTQQGGIVVVARSTETHCNVEVWDTGMGIRPVELPKVFDEFYQVGRGERSREGGLGMGLAIVKRLARLLGHSLTVVSQPGKGTMFRVGIELGRMPEIHDATAPADTLPMPVLEPRTVLVIDDEPAIREGLAILLEEWGYEVMAADSLLGAQTVLNSLRMPPDLILSDLHLGDAPDGIAAILAVRRMCGTEVPAILITGDTSADEMRRATESGYPVLFKPVQPRKLLNALRGMVP